MFTFCFHGVYLLYQLTELFGSENKGNPVSVSDIILEQLGGNKFKAMTGANDFLAFRNGLQFSVGRNSKGVTHCRIELCGNDLYMVTFIQFKGNYLKDVAIEEDVYGDQLTDIFESNTGLATSL